MHQIFLIIKREFLTRVRRKSFIITTLLMPLIFVGLMALPTVIAAVSGPENKTIAVVDKTGFISKSFLGHDEGLTFEVTDQPLDSLKRRTDLDGILFIPESVVDNPTGVIMYTNGSPSPQTDAFIGQMLNSAIEQIKLSRYKIENLDKILADVHTNVSIRNIRIDGDKEEESSSMASYFIGLLLTFVLYMFIMLYGQMVMTSIIEEKNNRVLEIVVSSVKPGRLLLGKILGVGAVAVTQIIIWGVLIAAFTLTVMPLLVSGVMTSGADVDIVQVLATVGNAGYVLGLFGLMAVFLILGYLFYSAIYAAIGSAVDNIQDASQIQIFALVPIVLGMVFAMTVLNDPNSTLAVWLSMIPFTSPMVMMARIPFGIPAWEIAVSLVLLVVAMFVMVWISAKIYRVGIFMYGKKPTIRDLARWARYK